MDVVLQALVPVFALILLGQFLRRMHFPGDGFWPLAERFTYYVLFPAMLVFKLGSASIPPSAYGQLLFVVFSLVGVMTLLVVVIQLFWKWPGAVFSSVFQGSLRFNTFVGLAAAGLLLGDEALSLFAVAIAIMIPLLNLLCILMFALVIGQGPVQWRSVFGTIIRNPGAVDSRGGIAIESTAGRLYADCGFISAQAVCVPCFGCCSGVAFRSRRPDCKSGYSAGSAANSIICVYSGPATGG